MYVLELRDTAFGHIRDAFDYYEMKLPGLGEQFLSELDACFRKLRNNPFA